MMNCNGVAPMTGARVIDVIETQLLSKGDSENNDFRIVKQYWTIDGKLLAEVDPVPDHERQLTILRDAIAWAMGQNGDFKARPSGAKAYWWREELRRRACGLIPPVKESKS